MGNLKSHPCSLATLAALAGALASLTARRSGLRGADDEDEVEEEAPSYLNTINCGHFLVISTDKLTATYTGDGNHGNDVGAIQGNRHAPFRRMMYYFEISVKDRGLKGYISIGFAEENFKKTRHPGWEQHSFGYHGDDGKLYQGQGRTDLHFGPTYTTGDTVGAGINYAAQELFFTKNGKLVGSVFKELKTPLFPTIGLHTPNAKVEVNFGQRPYVFDVDAFTHEEREKRNKQVESLPLPFSVSHSVVRGYLLHYGYQETLAAFDAASGGAFPPIVENKGVQDSESFALEHRKVLRRLCRNGDVVGVFAKLREWYPELLEDDKSTLTFLLHCQKFVELIKAGCVEVAVTYARKELAHFFGKSPTQDLHLQDCLALLAYEKPADSPVGYLLGLGQRETIADAVNAVVLAQNPALQQPDKLPQSALERLLRQLTACDAERCALNGGQGEVFSLQRVLQRGKDGW